MAKNTFFAWLLSTAILLLCFLSGSCQQITTRQKLVAIAVAEIGVKEERTNGGKRVDEYLKTVGLGTGFYWCAAFIKWDYKTAKINTPFPPNGAAASWFPLVRRIPIEQAQPGDVLAFYYANLGRVGHIAMLQKWESANVAITIEGNTSSGLSRNGDSVNRLRRTKRSIKYAANWIDKR